MPDYQHAEKTAIDSIEDHERYLLHGKGAIRAELMKLAKKPDIITAYFDQGSRFILTAVLGVVKERDLVVLDVGPDDATTHKAIESGRLVCTTKSMGVPVKFTLEGIKGAKYQGRAALAAPLPESLYRLQRREYFRVQVPRINGPTCEIPLGEGKGSTAMLKAVDLSVGGICLLVPEEERFDPPMHGVYKNCLITLPDFGELTVDLEIRNRGTYYTSKNEAVPRIGAAFINLSMQNNLYLQRYIYQLQAVSPLD
ncbi:MAG: flagellar brake protein [Pseudomonadota bacterium]